MSYCLLCQKQMNYKCMAKADDIYLPKKLFCKANIQLNFIRWYITPLIENTLCLSLSQPSPHHYSLHLQLTCKDAKCFKPPADNNSSDPTIGCKMPTATQALITKCQHIVQWLLLPPKVPRTGQTTYYYV